jgi:hypothetical protein
MFMDWPADSLHLSTDVYEEIDEKKVDFGVDVVSALVSDFERHGF